LKRKNGELTINYPNLVKSCVTDLVGSSPFRLSLAISYPKKALRTTSPVIEETMGRIENSLSSVTLNF
jgi:hypothetical protein